MTYGKCSTCGLEHVVSTPEAGFPEYKVRLWFDEAEGVELCCCGDGERMTERSLPVPRDVMML